VLVDTTSKPSNGCLKTELLFGRSSGYGDRRLDQRRVTAEPLPRGTGFGPSCSRPRDALETGRPCAGANRGRDRPNAPAASSGALGGVLRHDR
jgi:hypothetical protein